MALHLLEPDRGALSGQFSRTLAPALEVDSGDTVRYRTLDLAWGLENHREDGAPRRRFEPRESPRDAGPCLVGPVLVRGAEPGSVLEIRIEAVVPAAWGWTLTGDIGTFNAALNRSLGITDGSQHVVRWRLDPDAMTATNQGGHRVRLRPFLGTVGLALAAPAQHEAWPPRLTGGNLDCKELIAGSTRYLPVAVPGALVSVGVGHAAQGDGEAGGTAIECPMNRADLRYVVRNDLAFDAPRARTPVGWLMFGFGADLDAAAAAALNGMLDLLAVQMGVPRKEASALASAVVDLRVTQLVNGVLGVHAPLPHGAIG